MTSTNINVLKDIIANKLNIGFNMHALDVEDGFQAVLGLDSIGFIELRFQCEEAFNIKISDEYFIPKYFKNLKTLSALLDELQANQGVTA